MSNPIPQEYFKAGSIASRVRESIRKSVTSDARIIDICEEVESMIGKLGGKPAFPCNVCINEIAAHYTAEPDDNGRLHDNDIVKIDIGVHVEGYVADTATTVSFDPRFADLLDATEVTHNEVWSRSKEGVRLSEVGGIVSDVSKRRGFRPFVNLSGNSLDRNKFNAENQFLTHGSQDRFSLPKVKSTPSNPFSPCRTELDSSESVIRPLSIA